MKNEATEVSEEIKPGLFVSGMSAKVLAIDIQKIQKDMDVNHSLAWIVEVALKNELKRWKAKQSNN